jgi:hypothetical protein
VIDKSFWQGVWRFLLLYPGKKIEAHGWIHTLLIIVEHAVDEWIDRCQPGRKIASTGKKQSYILTPDQFNSFISGTWRAGYEKSMRTCHKFSAICRLDWHSPQLQKGASTAMPNNLQAGMGTAPRHRRGWGQNAAQLLFLRCLCPESSNHRFLLFLITTMSCLPRTAILLPCLPLYKINLLEVEEAVVCLHQSAQPTWPQLSACLSSVFCVFSISHHSQLGS